MKKKSTFIFALLSLILFGAQSQNLVPNPGFEVQDTCPAVSQIYKAQPWVTATLGTPDLYNSTCSTQNLTARTGIGSSGIYLFNTFANNREYMEAPLTTSLTAGQNYCVTFYVKRLNYRYATDRIGAYFHTGAINQSTTSVLSFVPQVDHAQHTIMNGTGWILITGNFTAAGGEDHIIIGSFHGDSSTDTLVANSSSTSKVAYYAIDDISVIACVNGVNENSLPQNFASVYPSPATDLITIELLENTPIQYIRVLNHLGQEVEKISAPQSSNGQTNIPVSSLSPGVYLFSIQTGQGLVNRKVIIANR